MCKYYNIKLINYYNFLYLKIIILFKGIKQTFCHLILGIYSKYQYKTYTLFLISCIVNLFLLIWLIIVVIIFFNKDNRNYI